MRQGICSQTGTFASTAARWRIGGCLTVLEHDLFRKPVPTFRDHALRSRECPKGAQTCAHSGSRGRYRAICQRLGMPAALSCRRLAPGGIRADAKLRGADRGYAEAGRSVTAARPAAAAAAATVAAATIAARSAAAARVPAGAAAGRACAGPAAATRAGRARPAPLYAAQNRALARGKGRAQNYSAGGVPSCRLRGGRIGVRRGFGDE